VQKKSNGNVKFDKITTSTSINLFVCSTPNENCFFGTCNQCNKQSISSILRNHTDAIDEDDEWTWSLWKTSNNKVDLYHIRSAISSLFDEIDNQWMKFLIHSYYNRQQRTYINDLRTQSSELSYVTVQIDFAENYTVLRQREVQAAHWNNLQATLFTVHIKIGTNHKNMVIISNYMRHDTAFVYCAQNLIVQFLNQHYPRVVKINYLR
jgi:hypothetical protein